MMEKQLFELEDVFPLYSAITMVLHFDYENRWTAPRTLKECFKNIPPALEPYVSDYKIDYSLSV
ncbi:MAG: hypothetical protein IKN43_06415 [Selenomonadaceae bacterium]|nr:hypothetical protein [Selenomonadaceae bacterium]